MIPRVVSLTSVASAQGPLKVGQSVTFIANLNRPVVVEGIPTLITADGGIAVYVPALSTEIALAFKYIVLSGDSSSNLTVIGLTTNGGSITAPGALTLADPERFTVGDGPRDIAVGDVDNDGKLDIVTADYGDDSVTVLRGARPLGALTGGYTFGNRKTFDVGTHPSSVALGEFDKLAGLDIVATNLLADTVTTLSGDNQGFFKQIGTASTGAGPVSVTSADVDHDGKLDLIVTTANRKVSVLSGDGRGGFDTPDRYDVGSSPVASAVADVDGDGDVDIFVVNGNSSSVSVLLNDGVGGFGYGNALRVGPTPTDIVTADVNADGKTDLIVTNSGDDTVSVLLGNGKGGFGAAIVSLTVNAPRAVAFADMDGDGTADLVVMNDEGVAIMDGRGNGAFEIPPRLLPTGGGRPTALAVADFNKDGLPDIVTANGNDDSVSYFRNTSERTEGLLLASILANAGTVTGIIVDGQVPGVVERLGPAGSFAAGSVLDLSLRFSEKVFVNGTPVFNLNTGGQATYVSGSSTDTLVFRTTVAAGQNADDLAVTSRAFAGTARIADGKGDDADLLGALGTFEDVVVDTTRARITGAGTLETGRFGTGQVVTIKVTGDEPLFVSGAPTLDLNNGGTATYVSGSGTKDLVFRYVIAQGEDSREITLKGINLPNGSTVRDAAGNDAVTVGLFVILPEVQVNTRDPVVLDLAVTPGRGVFDVGQTITFSLTMNEAVTVLGNPVLQLNDGGTATYIGDGRAATTLLFRTIVAAGQNVDDLAVTGVTVPTGAAIRSAKGGTDAYLASATETFDGVGVNTSKPFLEALVAAPGNATYGAGAIVTLILEMSKVVFVSGGTPTLTLDNGGVATYVPGVLSGTDRLVFTTVVTPGQVSPDLTVTALNLNGATIADGVGRAADLVGAVGNPAGTLVIDATAIIVTQIEAETAETGPLGVGDMVTFSLTVERAVTVEFASGAPTLALNDGGTAIFDAAASTATTLVFHHTVAAGQNAANLAVEALNLNGAIVVVPDGPLTFATPAAYAREDKGGYGYDTSTTIADLDRDGVPDLVVTNNISLSIMLGDGDGGFYPPTAYDPERAQFGSYKPTGRTVVADVNGDGDPDLIVPSNVDKRINVSLGDGTGNFANPTYVEVRDGGVGAARAVEAFGLGDLNRDGTPDIVVADSENGGSVYVLLGDGSGGFGAATPFAMPSPVSFARLQATSPLVVTDLDGDGYLDVVGMVRFNGGSGTAERTFVMRGDGAGGLGAATTIFTPDNQRANKFLVADINGDSKLDVAVLNPGTLSLSYALADGNGGFGAAATIYLDVFAFDFALTDLNGDGKLDLVTSADGFYDEAPARVYLGDGRGGFVDSLHIVTGHGYTNTYYGRLQSVTAGDLNADGRPDLVFTDRFQERTFVALNETLTPNVFDPADAGKAAGRVTGFMVDTTAPLILSDTANPARGTYDIGQTITLTLTGNEPLIVAGAPVLTLNNGTTATYVGGSGSTSLQFSTTVAAGHNTAALAVTDVTLPAGTTVRDAAGNDANLAGVPATFAGLSIVTTPPTVVSVTASPVGGSLGAGAVITLEVVLDKPVGVTRGVPTLTLNDGGIATYVSGSGTDRLLFTSTVATGQATPDLAISAVNLNGATVTDHRGQAANLTGAVTNPTGILAVSAPAVAILGIVATPSEAGPLGVGDTVAFTVTLDRGATVSGTPTLTLNDGGTATYDATTSTVTSLVFRHTVLAGQNTAGLAVTALTLNGAGIAVPGGLTFGERMSTPAGTTSRAPSVPGTTADLDGGAGFLDVIRLNPGAGTVSVNHFDATGDVEVPGVDYAVGLDPRSVTVGFVNRGNGAQDYARDILVANAGSGTVSVLLGKTLDDQATGAFEPARTIAVNRGSSTPRSVTLTDANADGRPDLLVDSGSAVFLMLGDGNGNFTDAGNQTPTTNGTVADVSGDGRPDAIVTIAGADRVSVLLGTEGGGFAPATGYGVGLNPQAVTVTDVNRDGLLDLVVANQGNGAYTLSLLLGTGGGAFSAATSIPAGAGGFALEVISADMNGDGNFDLLVGNATAVTLLQGTGTGGFGAAVSYEMGFNVRQIVAADVNGDSYLDLVAALGGDAESDPGGVSVRLGMSGGGFGSAIRYGTGSNPTAVAVADLNGDGAADLIVANGSSGTVSVLLGNGFGGFRPAANYTTGIGAEAIAVADLNGDGKLDLALANVLRQINVVLGNGTGGFGAPTNIATPNESLVAIAALDVNGDGRPDLVGTGQYGNVLTLLNQSAAPGTFSAGNVAAVPGASTSLVVDTKPTQATPTDIVVNGASLIANENAANGSVVGTVSGVDAGGLSLIFSLSDDAAGRFAINATTGQITVARGLLIDYEQATAHDITVKVTDDTGLSFSKIIPIQVSDRTPEFVTGDGNANTLVGGDGNDALSGEGGTDILIGGGGDDLIYGGSDADQLMGGSGNDHLYGEAGADDLRGGMGNDSLSGGAGNDTMDGGAGFDVATFTSRFADALLVQGGATTIFSGAEGVDTLTGIEQFRFTDVSIGFQPNLYGSVQTDTSNAGIQVAGLFDGILGREADKSGLLSFTNLLKNGGTVVEAADSILHSTEYTSRFGDVNAESDASFVTEIYQIALGRAPDQGGFDGWMGALNAGVSRGEIAANIALSAENFGGLIVDETGIFVPDAEAIAAGRMYFGLLDRPGDAAGVLNFKSFLESGATTTQAAQAFLDSTEYQSKFAGLSNADFVDELYENALGRDPDTGGFNAYTTALNNGTSRAQVAVAITQSVEAQDHFAAVLHQGWVAV